MIQPKSTIFFADKETTGETFYKKNGYTTMYIGYCCNVDLVGFYYLSVEDLLLKFYDLSNSRTKYFKLYFHNLSFDGKFIMHALKELNFTPCSDPKELDECRITKNCFSILWTAPFDKIYSLRIAYKDITIEIECTWLLFMMSVASIGKKLGFEKSSIEHDQSTLYTNINQLNKQVLEYVKRDVEIVAKWYIQYTSNISHKIKITSASNAMENFIQWYNPNLFVKHFGGKKFDFTTRKYVTVNIIDNATFEELYAGYYGGYTYINPKYIGKQINCENGHYMDINSSYPASMTKSLPYGYAMKNKPQKGSYCTIYKIKTINVTMKNKKMMPFLHNQMKKEGYASESYGENIVCTDIWLDLLKKHYTMEENINYVVLDKWYFFTKPTFKEYVEENYKLKEQNADDEVKKQYVKDLLNFLYGKFGQYFKRDKYSLKLNEHNTDSIYYPYERIKESVNSEQIAYIPVAMYITDFSRIELINAIWNNIDNFVYCDTDSIMTLDKPNDLKSDKIKLGYWKTEMVFNKLCVLKPKCYLINGAKIKKDGSLDEFKLYKKISGLNEEGKTKINWSNFKKDTKFELIKTRKSNVKGGIILVKSPFTL